MQLIKYEDENDSDEAKTQNLTVSGIHVLSYHISVSRFPSLVGVFQKKNLEIDS